MGMEKILLKLLFYHEKTICDRSFEKHSLAGGLLHNSLGLRQGLTF